MNKKRTSVLLLAAGTAIVATTGGAAYWWTQRVNHDQLPVGVSVVPQTALMTVSFSTDEGQWRRLRQYGTPTTQALFDQNLAQLRDRLLTDNGYSYKQDIQPWVGDEVTVAFLSSQAASAPLGNSASPPAAAQSQSAVMLLPIANPARAQQLLTKRQNSTDEIATRDYKGLQIRSFKGKAQNYFSTVIDQRLIAVSQDEKAIERIIDTDKGGASIARTPGYNQAVAQIQVDQPFMQVYVNVPVASTVAAANSTQPVPNQGLLPLQNNQGIAGAATLEADGIRFQGVGWLNPDGQTRYEVSNQAERMPSLLPAETLIMASGGNLKQLWQDYSQRSTTAADAFTPDRLRQGINSTTGLDLDKDLIAWMDGEFSLALLPIAAVGASPESAGLLFLVQSNDRRAADAALTKLDQAMSSQYGFRVSGGQVKGQPVVNWVSPFAAVNATHGWLDGNVLFLALGSPLANAILPQPEKSLAEDPLFQKSVASELDPKNGHFFANLDRLTSANRAIPLPYLPPQAASFLQATQAIGVTGAIQDDRTTRYDLFVTLDKAENNKPLPTLMPSPTKAPATPASP